MTLLEEVAARALEGSGATVEEALEIERTCATGEICDAADRVRMRWTPGAVDTCSIVNARSGRCPEDCKWCSQAGRHHTGVEQYDFIDPAEALRSARLNEQAGVRRFSLVTSGRSVSVAHIRRFCGIYRSVAAETGLFLCASMGLIGADGMKALADAGVRRYHCNLETSRNFFPSLCTTHTYDDKLRTIALAREAGMEVCSGGIIGMGESMRDRLELARESRDAGAVSMPVNVLNPIPGTPLGDTPLLDEEEIVRSAALMRLVAPKVTLRFAGGRMRLSHDTMLRMLRGGVNGALMGDMLTTVGNSAADDRALFAEAGYE